MSDEEDPDKTRALPRNRGISLPELDPVGDPEPMELEETPTRRQATQPIRRRQRGKGKATTSKLPRRGPGTEGEEEEEEQEEEEALEDEADGAALADFAEDRPRPRRKLRRAPALAEPELDFHEETPARRRAAPATTGVRPTTADLLAGEEPEGIRAVLLNPLVAWAAAAALLLVSIVLAVTRGGGVDPEALGAFYTHVAAGEVEEAEATLQALAPPEAVEPHLRKHLDRLLKAKARKLRREASRAFDDKKWTEALQAAQAAAEIDADGDLLFLIAESMRSSENPEAGQAYDQYLSTFPKHERRDDALFWRAESLAKEGQKARAVEMFKEILALPRSNFKRSAARRVEELDQ